MFSQSGVKDSRGHARWHRLAVASIGLAVLAGCEDGANFNPFQAKPGQTAEGATKTSTVKLVERDVEAPGVFQVTDMGLWDGRPSLGGVWVAHPDVKDPERVIIRNTANSKFVIGALFRRERDNPGPALQVSSDAANALGMLAGATKRDRASARGSACHPRRRRHPGRGTDRRPCRARQYRGNLA
jgi:hypothetical protein